MFDLAEMLIELGADYNFRPAAANLDDLPTREERQNQHTDKHIDAQTTDATTISQPQSVSSKQQQHVVEPTFHTAWELAMQKADARQEEHLQDTRYVEC